MKLVPTILVAAFIFVPSAVFSEEDRVLVLKQQMTEMMSQTERDSIAESLTSKGVAPSDAQSISNEVAEGIASCFVDALIENANEKRIPVDKVLDALELALSNKESPETTAMIDKEAVEDKATNCLYNVAQKAGIEIQ